MMTAGYLPDGWCSNLSSQCTAHTAESNSGLGMHTSMPTTISTWCKEKKAWWGRQAKGGGFLPQLGLKKYSVPAAGLQLEWTENS